MAPNAVSLKQARPYFTGVGSRDNVPYEILRLAEEIAYTLCERGYDFRSGRARGMDEAFERGAARYEAQAGYPVREIWLPKPGFRSTSHFDPQHGYVPTREQFIAAGKLLVRSKICPTFFNEPGYIQRLFGRNVYQIIGDAADELERTSLSDFVVYWAPENSRRQIRGGTRIAVYLARYLGLPTYNLGIETERDALLEILSLQRFYKGILDEEWGHRVDTPAFV